MSAEIEQQFDPDDDALGEAARSASKAIRSFIADSDVEPPSPKDPFCELFRLMSERRWPLEQALLRAKTLILVERGNVPRTGQNAERSEWLGDHLVQWVIACYYGVEIPTGEVKAPSMRYG